MRSIKVSLLLLSAALLTTAAEEFQEVSFPTSDGGKVYANLYGHGDHAVVLAHGAVFNKESWDAQAKHLARKGLRVLAIDFRGYGKSTAGSQGRALYLDVLAAVRYLEKSGAARVSVVGGSMGGQASAQAAVEAKPGEIDRLVLLAAGPIAEPGKLKGKKLFIVSEGERLKDRVTDQYQRAPEPKKLVVLPGSAHAQNVFKTPEGERLLTLITDWLTN